MDTTEQLREQIKATESVLGLVGNGLQITAEQIKATESVLGLVGNGLQITAEQLREQIKAIKATESVFGLVGNGWQIKATESRRSEGDQWPRIQRMQRIQRMDTEEQFREQIQRMECVFGLVGNGFTIVAADATTGYRFMGPGAMDDKIMVFDSHKLVGAIGNTGDRQMFTKHIERKAPRFKGTRLTTADTATFIRDELASTVERFKRVNMLLAGYDEGTGPSLYHIDCTASLNKVEKGAFGSDGSSYSLSAMASFHSGMSLDKAIELVDACIEEIRSSLNLKSENHIIKIVDEQGARHYAWRKPRAA